MLLTCFTLALHAPVQAQDDLYYDPATAQKVSPTTNNDKGDNSYDEGSNVTRRYANDDEEYHDEDDYAYEYSSRIRRFHRPSPVVDYYDPYYVDLYNYDPYYLPGNSIYTSGYNDYWTWRRWQRWNRWNRASSFDYGFGCNNYSPWGWNSGFQVYNAWSSPSLFNNYYYDPYWTWNGYNPYYSNGWSNNNYYYNNNHYTDNNGSNNYHPQTYTGVRRNGTSVNPGYARISDGGNGRLTAPNKDAPVIEMKSRPNGRMMPGKETNQVERTAPNTNSGRRPATDTPNGEVRGRNTAPVERPGRTSPTQTERQTTTPRSETTPGRRPQTESTTPAPRQREETRPTRQSQGTETRPARRQEQTSERPNRSESEQPQPSRRQTETRSDDRPSRSETRSTPQRTETPRSENNSSRERSGGDSGGSSSGSSSGSRGRRG